MSIKKSKINLLLFSGCIIICCAKAQAQRLPIQPDETLEFSTTEGSYMNVDVSPDGKQLLFDLLGDIHMVSAAGGDTRQLTRGIGVNLRPIWAPDGKFFAYVSDIVDGSQFHLRSVDGLKDSVLGAGYYDADFEFKKSEATIPREGYISPNGRYCAYLADTNGTQALLVYDVLKKTDRILVPSIIRKPYSYRANVPARRFGFAADSKSIFIGYGGKIHRVFLTGENRIVEFRAHVKFDRGVHVYNQFRVTHDSINIRYMRSVNRCADGSKIVFFALGKIYVQDFPVGVPRQLVSQDANQFQPVFSPDGKWVAYVSWNDRDNGHLWKVRSDGSGLQRLTKESGHYERPAWSPDGTLLAVVHGDPILNDRDNEGTGSLEVITSDGSQVIKLDDSIPLWNHLAFSSDGKQIIYQPTYTPYGNSEKGAMLAAINTDGSGFKVLAIGEHDSHLTQRLFSPDGNWLAFSAREDIYLLAVSDSVKPIILDARSPEAIKIGPGVDPVWEDGGRRLSWTYSKKFFSADVSKLRNKSAIQSSSSPNQNIKIDTIVDINISVPYNYGKGIIVLRGATIITMKGDEVIKNGTIVVKDGRIASIGKTGELAIPNDAHVIDVYGKTIMPGLIDLHLHMRISPNIFPQQSWMYLANLAYGVTTGRDPSLNFDSFGYAELLASGNMIGPRLYTVGRSARLGDGFVKLENYDEALALAKKRVTLGGTVVKQYMLDTRLQRQWMLMACHEAGLNMTNEGAFEPIPHLGMIKDGSTGIEHNPVWGEVYDDMLQLVAHSGIFYTPTLQLSHGVEHSKEYFKYKYWHTADDKMKRFIKSDPKSYGLTLNGAETLETIISAQPKDTVELAFVAQARINARMIKKGGKIAMGSHGNNQGIGAHNELWALQMGGLTNLEALRAATLTGAEGLGIQKDLGSLEKGKIADLLILNKNPLEDIHNSREIRSVMKDGILYEGATLNQQWPSQKILTSVGR